MVWYLFKRVLLGKVKTDGGEAELKFSVSYIVGVFFTIERGDKLVLAYLKKGDSCRRRRTCTNHYHMTKAWN